MNETRQTVIEELEDEVTNEDQSPQEIRDELFELVKNNLLNDDQLRLLQKFYLYGSQHSDFELDVSALSDEDADQALSRCHTLARKIVQNLATEVDQIQEQYEIDTLNMILVTYLEYKQTNFKIVLEIFEDSFDLEIVL
jgi:hypothetical protein